MILTWFGCGRSPVAPGTVGSLGALPFAWIILDLDGPTGLLMMAGLLFICGWLCAEMDMPGHDSDPSWIVVDEVVGMWIAAAAAPLSLLWFGIAFLLFRFFDILKPWPVGWADRKVGGGMGVMLDDVFAGIYAAVIIVVARLAL